MDPDTPGTSRTSTTAFVKADSRNLPYMDLYIILEYLASSDKHNIAEIRGAKTKVSPRRSSKDSYTESAIGYVELQRSLGECIVRGKITPEHKITSKNYSCSVTINELQNTILDATCECAASAGGCKHTMVFLFWLSKRSSEPASTSVQCYWKKPRLSSVSSQPLEAEMVFKKTKEIDLLPKDPSIMPEFVEMFKENHCSNSLILLFQEGRKKPSYNLFDMTLEFMQEVKSFDFKFYKKVMDAQITEEVIVEIEKGTKMQSRSLMWHSIRQGRVTASKIYEASKCKKDGVLMQQFLGGYKVPETVAIKRGKVLEEAVIREVEKTIKKNIYKSGFILINSLIGASPDGVGDDFIVEVKCPSTEKSVESYIGANKKIKNKYNAQMQLQMMAAKKSRGLFCIADPAFKTEKKVDLYWIQFDKDFTNHIIEEATKFWENFIFQKLINSAKL